MTEVIAVGVSEHAVAVAGGGLAIGESVFIATHDTGAGMACPATVIRSTAQDHRILLLQGTPGQRQQLVLALLAASAPLA